jgi:hypothetical protein
MIGHGFFTLKWLILYWVDFTSILKRIKKVNDQHSEHLRGLLQTRTGWHGHTDHFSFVVCREIWGVLEGGLCGSG